MNKLYFTFIFSMLLMIPETILGFELNDSTAIELSELQVDASRDRHFPGTGKVLQAFSSAEILRTPAQSMDAFMKTIPGVDVRQRSIGGTQADISIRGGSFDQVLILLNGVNITDQQTGHHNLNIPVELSEVTRIEVLQGSAARRYGSQAFSGAINIITDPQTKNKIDVSLTGGSFDTYSQKLTLGAGSGSLSHFTSLSHHSSQGYRENTDYDIFNLFSQTNLEATNAGEFDFQLGYQHKSFGANSFYTQLYPNQFEHTQTLFSSLNWQKYFQHVHLSATMHYRKHYDRFELFRDFEGAASWYLDHNYHMTDVAGFSADVEYMGAMGKISAGTSVRYDHIFSTVLGELIADEAKYRDNLFEKGQNKYFNRKTDRLVNTAYLDFSKAMGSFYFSAGTSLSHSQDYGMKHHWGADISYVPLHNLTVYASLNTASRLPTFTDLYYQNATHISNPDLKPESSLTSEGGVKYDIQQFSLQAGGFYRVGSNIIDWVRYPGQEQWESMNLTSLHTSGLNISTGYRFLNSFLKRVSLAYSFINTDKQASDYDSKYALDYLRHQFVFNMDYQLVKQISMSWNASFNDRTGGYTDFDTGQLTDYKPYLLAGCRIAWEKHGLLVYADLNNLLNESFVDYGGLPQPGRYGNLGIRWKMK
jgi:vitamin B12 transporter